MQTCVFALSHKHWRLHAARHVASACRDMARLQPGPEQPFPTVWDDAGREVLDRALPFLALADSTFQGLLRIQGGKWASYGFPSLGADSGYAVVCPGSSLIKAAPPRPSILQAQHARHCCLTRPCPSTKWGLIRTSWLFCDSTSTPRSRWDWFHVATASHLHSRHGLTTFKRRGKTSTWESMSSPGASWISMSQGFSSMEPKTSCTFRLAHSFKPSGASSDALCTT